MANTLFEYYKSKGQNLPGIKDRAKTYESLGMGTGYQGTTDQNVGLLTRLQSMASKPASAPVQPAVPVPPPPVNPTPPAPPSNPGTVNAPGNDSYASMFDTIAKKIGLDAVIEKVKSGFGSAPKKADIYNTEIANAGIDQKTNDLNSLNTRIANIDSSLAGSDKDIRDRINRSGGIVTDSQVQRLVAAETAPLLNEYKTLVGARGTLEGGVKSAEERAKTMAEMKYSDATAPQDATIEQFKLLSGLTDKAYNPAEKDLSERLKTAAAADTTKNDLALKGYNYVSTPAERDSLKAQGYDIIQINGRTYAKPGALKTYEDKKQIDSKFKAPTSKAPANKNYTATNIPANIKGDLLADIQNKDKKYTKEEIYKAYPEVSTTYINSLYSNRQS